MPLKYPCVFLVILLNFAATAQDTSINTKQIDSLKTVLATTHEDSKRIFLMGRLGFNYQVINIDSALKYTQEGISLAQQTSNAQMETNLLATLSGIKSQQGKFAEALDLLFKSLKKAEDNNLTYEVARAYRRIGGVYFDLENYPKAINYGLKGLRIDEEEKYHSAAIDRISLANAYEKMGHPDSALFYAEKAIGETDLIPKIVQTAYRIAGDVHLKKGNYKIADSLLREGLTISQRASDMLTVSEIYTSLAAMFLQQQKKDSALFYALQGFDYAKKVSSVKGIMVSATQLAALYDSTQPLRSLAYYKIIIEAKDSLFGVKNIQSVQNLISQEEEKQQELEKAKQSYRNSLKLYGLLSGLAGLIIVAFILFRNNRQKQKANILLYQQKEKLETTLSELKSTQAQLIQSEKMASLGQLTAGIAHEIQNPLNFVNNFSEVNTELIEEAEQEMLKNNINDVKIILADIKNNEQKINHHGKRAGEIVKGMLQHSRNSSGKKETADINKLVEEYLRLAYHGAHAKDPSFNATLNTDYDNRIGSVSVIPQEIGRVLLNLITNAFYAVDEKRKQVADDYQPAISISTKKINDAITIKVEDNGNGIPAAIVDKIFQPFFTTKPTGMGTGLGLSLAYDIVKSHGGEINVQTKEGEGTAFKVILPA